jgi:predicted ArsR family transcriptional regulator
VKPFIHGHYFPSNRELDVLKNPVNRKIIETLMAKYPAGMTANDINASTGLPIPTIHAKLGELEKESFIKSLTEKRRDSGVRPSTVYILENVSARLYPALPYQLAPGYVKFSQDFLSGLGKIDYRQDEEQLHTDLIRYISKIIRLAKASPDAEVRKIIPAASKEYCCLGCGVNHESRDFIRSVLIDLIDRLDVHPRFVGLLKENEFLTD